MREVNICLRDDEHMDSHYHLGECFYNTASETCDIYMHIPETQSKRIADNADDYSVFFGTYKTPIKQILRYPFSGDLVVVVIDLPRDEWEPPARQSTESDGSGGICAVAGYTPRPTDDRTPLGYITDLGSVDGFNI